MVEKNAEVIQPQRIHDPFGDDAEEFLDVQRAGDRRGDLVNGPEILDLGLEVRLGLLQLAAKEFELPQFPVAFPDLLPEGGEFPPDPGAHDGMEGRKEPRPGGKDPACARRYLPRPPIRGPEDRSVKKQVQQRPEDEFPAGDDPGEGTDRTKTSREPGDAQEGCRDNTDPDGEEGNFPPNPVIQGKVLSR